MTIDTTTGIVPAYGLIATPGAIDCHVHILGAGDDGRLPRARLHDADRRRHGARLRRRHEPALLARAHDGRLRRLADQHGLHLASLLERASAGGVARVGLVRVQDPRGPRRVPGRDRPDAAGCRRARRPGHDPHRLDQRVRVARGHDRRDRRAHDPRLPRRGRGRRARARPARDRLRAPRAAVLDEPDEPVLVVGHQGAPRHDHVGAPDEPGDPRGRGVRAVARAARRRWPPRTCSTISAPSR